jgi:hypothetical protein
MTRVLRLVRTHLIKALEGEQQLSKQAHQAGKALQSPRHGDTRRVQAGADTVEVALDGIDPVPPARS